MVSEGVDVPRLAVGVYATSAVDPAVLRAGRRPLRAVPAPGRDGERVLPSVPVLLQLASELEAQRDHVLGKPHRAGGDWNDELLARGQPQEDEPGEEEKAFTSLGADAELDQVIYDGAYGTRVLGADEAGLPGPAGAAGARAGAGAAGKRQDQRVAKGSPRSGAQARASPATEPTPPPRAERGTVRSRAPG